MAQRWRPDTCRCVVIEDTSTTPKTMTSVESKCVAHTTVPDNQLYAVLYSGPRGENKRKNLLDKFLKADADLGQTLADGSRTFANGVTVTWVFTGTGADRVLAVTVTGITLTTQRRNRIQAFIDANFPGQIVLA